MSLEGFANRLSQLKKAFQLPSINPLSMRELHLFYLNRSLKDFHEFICVQTCVAPPAFDVGTAPALTSLDVTIIILRPSKVTVTRLKNKNNSVYLNCLTPKRLKSEEGLNFWEFFKIL